MKSDKRKGTTSRINKMKTIIAMAGTPFMRAFAAEYKKNMETNITSKENDTDAITRTFWSLTSFI